MLAMLTAVLLMMTVIPLSAFAATETGGTTGECIWRLDGTVLTISGNGKMEDYDGFCWSNSAPWWSFDLTEVMIESGVTQIGSYAFYDCKLTGVELVVVWHAAFSRLSCAIFLKGDSLSAKWRFADRKKAAAQTSLELKRDEIFVPS